MAKEFTRETITIDASGMSVGRLAAEVAMKLMGKNKPTFERYVDTGDFVIVNNASQLKFTGRKLEQKDYYHHSQYPGGLKRTPMKKLFQENPADVVHRAVFGMLPKNKLRNGMIKRLTINA